MLERAVRVLVSGQVQMVGYRQACRSVARSLGLFGWVRNLVDGRVELFAQGSSESIDKLIDWAWSGPRSAVVVGVETDNVAVDRTLTDFFIQPNPEKSS